MFSLFTRQEKREFLYVVWKDVMNLTHKFLTHKLQYDNILQGEIIIFKDVINAPYKPV